MVDQPRRHPQKKRSVAYFRAEWSPTDAAAYFAPFTEQVEAGSAAATRVSVDLPFKGRVLRVSATQNSGAAAGSTTIGIHLGADGDDPSGTASETKTVSFDGINASQIAEFSNDTEFDEGARLSIGVDPTTDPSGGYLQLTVAVEMRG